MPRSPSQSGWMSPGKSRVLLRLQRKALERALDAGTVIPKDPRQVEATPPRGIARGGRQKRLELIRRRHEVRKVIDAERRDVLRLIENPPPANEALRTAFRRVR